jgi:spore coat protein A
LHRRHFLGIFGGAGAAAIVGVPLLSGINGSTSTGELLPSRIALPRPFTLPFKVPPVLRPTSTDAATDHYEIVQRAAVAEILPGVRTPIWGYNGILPGPTIVSTSGRRTVVTHRNELPVPVTVHLHGGHTPPEHDGYPIDLLYPAGGSAQMTDHQHMSGHDRMTGATTIGRRDYVYPLNQPAATLWYHDHRMDFTGAGVWRGLAGLHIIHDPHELSLGLPSGERDLPLVIMDRSFGPDGSLQYPSLDPTLMRTPGVRAPYGAGVLGDVILVNGVPWPLAQVPAVRHRLRLLNASNARRYRLVLDPPPPGGPAFVQVGTDGGLLAQPLPHDALELAPAQRFDVVVDFGRYRPGQLVTVRNEWGDGTTEDVMRFHIAGTAADASRIPDQLSAAAPLREKDAVVTRTLRFRHDDVHGMAGWTVNGRPFSPDVSSFRPKLGTTEIWQLMSDFHHPIHVHLTHFQVLSRGTNGPGDYDHGPKDTIDLRPGEHVSILVRFADYAGRYLVHCHNLEHEDMAMMANFTTVR